MSAWVKRLCKQYIKGANIRLRYWLALLFIAVVGYVHTGWKVLIGLGAVAIVGAVIELLIIHSEHMWAFTFPRWRNRDLLDQILRLNTEQAKQIALNNIERYFSIQEWPPNDDSEQPHWQKYFAKFHPTLQELFRRYYCILWPSSDYYIWSLGPVYFKEKSKSCIYIGDNLITEPGKPDVFIGRRRRRLRRYPSIYHFLALLIEYSKRMEDEK